MLHNLWRGMGVCSFKSPLRHVCHLLLIPYKIKGNVTHPWAKLNPKLSLSIKITLPTSCNVHSNIFITRSLFFSPQNYRNMYSVKADSSPYALAVKSKRKVVIYICKWVVIGILFYHENTSEMPFSTLSNSFFTNTRANLGATKFFIPIIISHVDLKLIPKEMKVITFSLVYSFP